MQTWDDLNQTIVECRRCPRLVEWRQRVAREKRRMYRDWEYWGRPVPGFGDRCARLLILGLAPGAHGSNRTGRMFTGDASGNFLYAALHRNGFASQPESTHCADGLQLKDAFITAICRCAPPDNKPLPEEIQNCQPFLLAELRLLERLEGIVALGGMAFSRALRICQEHGGARWGEKAAFSHGQLLTPQSSGHPWILASYHPSRQNTQTGRLTAAMFDEIWLKAKRLLESGSGN